MNILSKKTPALYINSPANIQFLTGFKGSSGFVILTKKYLYLFLDSRYLSEAKTKASKAKGLKARLKVVDMNKALEKNVISLLKQERIKTIGFEEKSISYLNHKYWQSLLRQAKINFNPTTNLIEQIRAIKSNAAIKSIIAAQRIAEKVLLEIKNHLVAGVKEKELAWKIEYLGRFYGAESVSFPPLVCFGKNSAVPHHEPNDTPLKKGDLILLDFGYKVDGLCSDMTRLLFTDAPTPLQEKVYKTLLEAQKQAVAKIRPGMNGEKADSFGREVIKKAKFGDYFTHSLGHGVGLEIHELPNLSPKFKQKTDVPLQKDMVVTIEPGIYLEDKFGMRLEDMIVIGSKGNKNLTEAPKNLKDMRVRNF